jgi:hypothetical protein
MPEPSSSGLPAPLPTSEGDRRVWIRYPSCRATYCRSADKADNQFLPAQACDISLGGIKLLSAHKSERGATLLIGKLDDGSQKAGLMTAQVRYAIPTPEGRWIMGCAFLKELDEEELLAWLKEQG